MAVTGVTFPTPAPPALLPGIPRYDKPADGLQNVDRSGARHGDGRAARTAAYATSFAFGSAGGRWHQDRVLQSAGRRLPRELRCESFTAVRKNPPRHADTN